MEAKYSHEVLENQQLIKKVPKEIYNNCRKKILQQKGDCIESHLGSQKKSKKKKLKIAKDLLQSNDFPSLDEDEIAKIKDEESQKLAQKLY
ncbi:12487_t:CDS:2 [Cetraspora pellucida]|uniref:12487_t:CDS:1 n=1 Tax=Cetraspora pellucida TaxID=1433469 RepID=A0A9N9HPQ4_9GLOM|nr:12487_t:CDS:2 [Cetraspora pellucida]